MLDIDFAALEVMEGRLFPAALLKADDQTRKKYFGEVKIGHSKLADATEKLVWVIENLPKGSIVGVVGPTGVGKTTLCEKLHLLLHQKLAANPRRNLGQMAVAGILAVSSEDQKFNWTDLYVRADLALKAVLIDKKIGYVVEETIENGRKVRKSTPTKANRRLDLETDLLERLLLAFTIDNAQDILKIAGPDKYLRQLNMIKSLVDNSHTTFVLLGTYDLIDLGAWNAQLDRRTLLIELGRYSSLEDEDVNQFKGVLTSFQKHMPFEEEPDLVHDWQYYYTGSLGCVGMLKDWLSLCVSRAIDSHLNTLPRDVCEEFRPSYKRLKKRLEEITKGEKALADTLEAQNQLLIDLGFKPGPSIEDEGQDNRGKKSTRPVGEAKPQRFPVGGYDHA